MGGQDKHGQEHSTGTSRAEQTTETMAELGALEAMAELGAQEAMAVQGAQEAMAGGHSWPWPPPSARPLQPEPGLDWDKKSALAFFGPGGPPPPYNIIYIYDIHYHSKVFEQ